MALTASCPSCGAPVVFQSAGSIFAVCAYCQSTLVRHDQALEDIGKMAALVEDRSPLQLGSEGVYKDVHFALIGRIQIKYPSGVWNEWHILFDDMRTAWLSEAGGEYVLTFQEAPQEMLPAQGDLKVGQRFVLQGQPWTVSNIENAECIAGAGELPFKVGAGYPVVAVDLRNRANFATLDYSDTPPLLFIGEAVDFAALKMANLRDGQSLPTTPVEAQVFRCPSCGAPMQARSADILAVGCATCGAVVDTSDLNHRILSAALDTSDQKFVPRLALGSKGTLEGKPVEVIGFMVRRSRSDGIAYAWREYLLAGENGTYRWLTEYNGHWNVVDVLSRPPSTSGVIEVDNVRYGDASYRHFATTLAAEVIQVNGEFTWRVRRGDVSRVIDYVAPPAMLSCEFTDNEITWSRGSYVAPEVIATAFGIKSRMIAPVGVYANQPNPWEETHRRVCRLFWRLAVVAVVLQLVFAFIAGGRTLLRQDFTFSRDMAEESVVSQEFEVRGKPRKLTISNETSLSNNWLGLDMMLVNKATGDAWPANREIAYYAGGSGEDAWSEGSREDEIVFLDIPPGTYYLTLDPEVGKDNGVPVRNQLRVTAGSSGWSNFVFVLLFLMVFPVFTRLRLSAFEAARWAESDHAPVDSDGDDD